MKSRPKTDIRAVIFDFDNTLVDTHGAIKKAYDKIFEDMSRKHRVEKTVLLDEINRVGFAMVNNVDKTKQNYDRGRWFELMSKNLGLGLSKKEINHYKDIFYSYIKDEIEFSQNTDGVLAEIKARGKKLALLTERDDVMTGLKQQRVERMPFFKHFDLVVVAGDTIPESKKEPAAFSKTLELLQVAPKHSLMIGDRIDIDIEHGGEIGMHTAFFKSYADPADPKQGKYKPDYIISDVREVLNII